MHVSRNEESKKEKKKGVSWIHAENCVYDTTKVNGFADGGWSKGQEWRVFSESAWILQTVRDSLLPALALFLDARYLNST